MLFRSIDRLREVLSFLGKPVVKQKANNNTLIFRFDSEILPIQPIRLKVETNCREHFNVLGLTKADFRIENQWFSGECSVTTYKLDELLGTKLRALYQRRKGRDLFDLYKALNTVEVNTEYLIRCYYEYMDFVVDKPPTKKEFLLNMEQKIVDDEFLGDTSMLLRPEENYNPEEAYHLVREEIIERL